MSTDPASMAHSPAAAGGEAHSAAPAPHHVSRLYLHQVGLWLFILSETFLFSALITSRYFLHGLDRPEHLDQLLGLIITLVLIASSWTAYRAEMFAAHGDQKKFQWHILATIGLGVLFVVGVGIEWHGGFRHFPPSDGFGTIFFTTTGIHAFHVLTGLIALTIVFFLGRSGRFTSGRGYWGVEGSVKYWHFVDVAWVFIYPTLYLVN